LNLVEKLRWLITKRPHYRVSHKDEKKESQLDKTKNLSYEFLGLPRGVFTSCYNDLRVLFFDILLELQEVAFIGSRYAV
jgi:hypothetical protein